MFWKRREIFKSAGAFLWGSLFGVSASSEVDRTLKSDPRGQRYTHPWADEETIFESYDIVVVGGGIAGFSAAVSAARNGAKVALVHERSMLGGNSSSEVKLYPENATAHQVWIKECGIFDEIHVEERVRNHIPYREGKMNSIWDLTLYEWVLREPNITLYLNTHMHRVRMADPSTIESIYCIQLGSEKSYVFSAPILIDTTGDGVLAHRAGAETRWGREARSVYDEPLA
ncbi:MAG: FAD-dependent oxidoreductase, partial [Candidatus Omnitrophica bacterium]|nr:FAD-dependent oxidoreductase [Candidatus Omnitrophota bacterium]